MDTKNADQHVNASLPDDVTASAVGAGRRRRSRSLSLALPVLGLSALLLAGCGAADDGDDGEALHDDADAEPVVQGDAVAPPELACGDYERGGC